MQRTLRHPDGPEGEAIHVSSSAPARADEHGFITPDAVALDLEVATVGSRGVAYLLDLALFLVVALILFLIQLALVGGGWFQSGLGVSIALVLAFAWQFGYPIGFETLWNGRTLGKAAVGLRVVTVEGAPVGVRHATIRAVTAPVELLLTSGLVASLSSFLSRRAQRLGDMAAGTLVVRDRRIAPEPEAADFQPPHGAGPYVAQVDVSRVDTATYGLIRATLRRRATMRAAEFDRLAAEVATAVAPRVAPQPPAGTHQTAFLQAVAAAVQQRVAARRPAGPAAAPWARSASPPATPYGGGPPSPPTAPGREGPSAPPPPPAEQGGDTRGRDPRQGFQAPG